MNSETRNKMYVEVITNFLENDQAYDFKKVASKYPNVIVSEPSKALEYVRINLPRDLFDRFYAKVYPLEVCKYNDEATVTSKKENVMEAAKLVANKKMSFLEAVENLEMPYEEYIYLVKQLSVKYRAMNMTTFLENKKHYDHVRLTIDTDEGYGFLLSANEEKVIKSVLEKFNLSNNSETRHEAYKYAVNKGLIKSLKR